MDDKPWKRHERSVAKALGGQRVPVNGRAGNPDVAHPLLAIECKERRSLPRWIEEAMAQAEKAATDGRLPVAVLHQAGERRGKDLVLLRLADFKRLLAVVGVGSG